jgi:hypothetical protein
MIAWFGKHCGMIICHECASKHGCWNGRTN